MDYEIRSTAFPYNMASWCTEKARYTLFSIVYAIDELHSSTGLEETIKDSILQNLHGAIWDASKLLAFGCGADWEVTDPMIISDRGYDGLEEVMVRYGILSETQEDRRQIYFEHFASKVEELIEGDRTPNRTFFHELIQSNDRLNHPSVGEISDLLEQVTMGEIEWSDFVNNVRGVLRKYRKVDST